MALYSLDQYWIPIIVCLIIVPSFILILYIGLIRREKWSFRDFGFTFDFIGQSLIVGAVSGILLSLLSFEIAIHGGLKTFSISVDKFALIFTSSVIAAPLWEELAFRGVIFGGLTELVNRKNLEVKKRLYGYVSVYFFVAIFFMVVHIKNVLVFLPNLVLYPIESIVYSGVFHYRRNIVAPIFSHSLYNLFILFIWQIVL